MNGVECYAESTNDESKTKKERKYNERCFMCKGKQLPLFETDCLLTRGISNTTKQQHNLGTIIGGKCNRKYADPNRLLL